MVENYKAVNFDIEQKKKDIQTGKRRPEQVAKFTQSPSRLFNHVLDAGTIPEVPHQMFN